MDLSKPMMTCKICESCSSTPDNSTASSLVSESFRRRRLIAVWRPVMDHELMSMSPLRRRSYVHDFPTRKQRMALRRRIRQQVPPLFVNNRQTSPPPYVPPSWVKSFAEPKVSTIKEEQLVPKPIIDEPLVIPHVRSHPIKKAKDLEDKVAALQLVVNRLHKLCLEKPEAVESTLSEETIQQFNEIRL